MLREMTSAQLDEWIAFYRIEPWGLAVLDAIAASIKALIVNINIPKNNPKVRRLEKLMLWPERAPKRIESTLDVPEDGF